LKPSRNINSIPTELCRMSNCKVFHRDEERQLITIGRAYRHWLLLVNPAQADFPPRITKPARDTSLTASPASLAIEISSWDARSYEPTSVGLCSTGNFPSLAKPPSGFKIQESWSLLQKFRATKTFINPILLCIAVKLDKLSFN
jgi:hypothetical protein